MKKLKDLDWELIGVCIQIGFIGFITIGAVLVAAVSDFYGKY